MRPALVHGWRHTVDLARSVSLVARGHIRSRSVAGCAACQRRLKLHTLWSDPLEVDKSRARSATVLSNYRQIAGMDDAAHSGHQRAGAHQVSFLLSDFGRFAAKNRDGGI